VSTRTFHTTSEEETLALGRLLAGDLPRRAVILLIGNRGAGKTTLAKGIIDGLDAAAPDDVSSPTFTLIHEYGAAPGFKVFHIDLYRLDHAAQVASLGLDEILDRDAVVLLEWAERFPELLPDDRVEIRLTVEGEEGRRIEIRKPGSNN
jgi:tRNA threonylcarbamoyladenosine biosynthesis protein TsaE